MPRWLPERSRDEILKEVAAKRRFMGSAEHGPAATLPDTSFRVPGPYKRPQNTWPAFTYLPPPAVIDMRSWTFETYGLVNSPLALTYDQIKALPTVTSVEDHACFDQIATPGHGFEGVDFRTIIELTQPDDAGLIPTERCVALLAAVRDGRLVARPSFFQLQAVRKARTAGTPLHLITHEDVLIFRRPHPQPAEVADD